MISKLTREELLNIIETDHVQCGEASALARMALATMDGEPVAWEVKGILCHTLDEASKYVGVPEPLYADPRLEPESAEPLAYMYDGEDGREYNGHNEFSGGGKGVPLYRHAQPAPDREQVRREQVRREQVRREHAEWSQATFGNVGPIGPLKHLRREVLEVIAKPHDLIEWADMQFLLWDAQRRAGITDEQITQAMIEKLAVNKLREWPEPKDGEPRLHIKAQPAPVVLKDHQIRELVNQLRDVAIKYHGAGQLREQIARVVRAAFQAQPVCTCPSGDGSLRWPCPAHHGNSPAHSGLRPEQSSIAPAQDGNSPVIPDGYVIVPKEPTEDMVIAGFESEPDEGFSELQAWEAYEDMSGCEQAAHRARLCWAAMLAAAPQEVQGE